VCTSKFCVITNLLTALKADSSLDLIYIYIYSAQCMRKPLSTRRRLHCYTRQLALLKVSVSEFDPRTHCHILKATLSHHEAHLSIMTSDSKAR
jgi:hypothetical protein